MVEVLWDNKCPYCSCEQIEFFYHVEEDAYAVDADLYKCEGSCQKRFYVQRDGHVVMTPTMQDRYLNSYQKNKKIELEEAAIEQDVALDLPVCGNCVSYIWGKNFNSRYDRHEGSCFFQDEKYNPTTSDHTLKGQLHALMNACECKCYYSCRVGVQGKPDLKPDRVGKRNAGSLVNGIEYKEFPKL